MTRSAPRCRPIRGELPDRTQAQDGKRATLRDVGELHSPPRSGQDVREVEESLVGRPSGTGIGPNCACGTRRYSA